jgi:hypothetical protein
MNGSNQFGNWWYADPDTTDFVRQTAGLDLLNAAMLVQSVAADLSYLEPLLLSDEKRGMRDLAYLDLLLLSDN